MSRINTIGKTGNNGPLRSTVPIYFFYFIFLLLLCIYSYKKPAYNWDILPYMGVVLKYETGKDVHAMVYQIAENEIPGNIFKQLSDSTNKYRWNVARSAGEYDLQLPFYVIKPLYTWMAYVFYKAGIPLTKATVLPSIISFFLVCSLMLYWLHRYVPLIFAFIASIFIAIWGPVLMLARLSTPDGLSAMLLLFAFYFLIEKRNVLLTYVFLLLAILARIDNILACLFILAIMGYSKKPGFHIGAGKLTGMLLGTLACYLFVSSRAYHYGWNLSYYSEFYKHLNPSYDIHASFSLSSYWSLVKSQLMTGLFYSHLPLFCFLATILLSDKYFFRKMNRDIDHLLALTFLVIIAIRFILQPVISDRLYIAYYLVILIFLIRRFHSPTAEIADQDLPPDKS